MSATDRFVAQILETSAAGYAGMATSLLMDRHPELVKRYEPDGFSSWKAQLQRWLLDLSAAVETGEPALFEQRVLWTREAFAAREASIPDLRAALEALRDLLRDQLPPGSLESAVPVVDRALLSLADAESGQADAPDPDETPGLPALSYLQKILEGKPAEAVEQVLAAADGVAAVRHAYLNVLIPAQREVGRLWHAGELGVVEEHVITATTQRVMTLLCERARPSSRKDKTVVLASVAGNVHDVGIRALSDFFEMAGWRAISLGPDCPHEEIAKGAQFFEADLVLLAATLDPHLKSVQRAIESLRALEDRDVKVIVGGPVFDRVPDLWRKVGADGYSARLEDAEPLGARLTR